MKKLSITLFVLLVLMLLKLSYDVYQLNNLTVQLQSRVDHVELNENRLNDQLIAIKRTEISQSNAAAKLNPASNAVHQDQSDTVTSNINPSVLIKQKLEFIQFAIQQQQWAIALDHLRLLDEQIGQYVIAESLKQSTHEALRLDYQSVQKYVIQKQDQQMQLIQTINNINDLVEDQLNAKQFSIKDHDDQYFWQKWIQVERIGDSVPQIDDRKSVLKDVETQLVFAEQALWLGQYKNYQRHVQRALHLIQKIPDAESKNIQQQLIQLQQMKNLPTPQLKAHAIFG